MIERLVQALVGILVADVLADHVNRELVDRVLDSLDELFPRRHAALRLREVQVLEHDAIEPFGGEHQRHFVYRRDVLGSDHRFFVDVAEERNLLLDLGIQEPIRPAQQNVRLNPDRPQIADAVLRRLRLELAGRADERHEREMDVQRVVAPDVLAELPDGLQERQALDVAHRPADLDEDDVDVIGGASDGVLDLVGDVRNDLDRAAQVVSAPLFLDHALIDLAGRPVGMASRRRVGEALVVSEIEVGLGAVVGHVDLAVLIRAHGAGIDVDVGVELLQRDLVPVAFEQATDRRRRQALAQRGHDAAGHENVFGGGSVRLVHGVCH